MLIPCPWSLRALLVHQLLTPGCGPASQVALNRHTWSTKAWVWGFTGYLTALGLCVYLHLISVLSHLHVCLSVHDEVLARMILL